MTKILKLSAIVLVCSAISLGVFAQEKTEPKDKKDNSDIIIHQKCDSNEKLTIVIDGDKVTVNGKPIDDFKSDNVDIIRGGDEMKMPFAFAAPMAPRGNWNVMGDDFMREIHSNKAFLGVMTKEGDGGAEITDVTKESPAEKAGLKEGDLITKVNDDKIADADDLYKAIGKYKPGEKVNVTYKRDGKESTASVELTENKQVRVYSWKNGDNDNFNFNFKTPAPYMRGWNGDIWGDRPRLGVQVQDTEDGKGVKVLEVEDDEPAGKAGLQEDDIITQVNGKNVSSVDDLKETMKAAKKGDTLKVTYLRDGKSQTVDIKFPKDLKTTDL
jgi:serine protease Do